MFVHTALTKTVRSNSCPEMRGQARENTTVTLGAAFKGQREMSGDAGLQLTEQAVIHGWFTGQVASAIQISYHFKLLKISG